MSDSVLEVVSAVIIECGRVLLTQRDPDRSDFGWMWESPGGKVKQRESHAQALRREIREEIEVDANICGLLAVYDFEPPEIKCKARVSLYRVRIGNQKPVAKEVLAFGWFSREETLALSLLPANKRFRRQMESLIEESV